MKRKSSRTFIPILLFVLLLGTSATAYADAIAITSATVSNLQIVPTSGTVVFTTQSTPATRAHAVVSDGFEGPSNDTESPTRSEAVINLGFASAGAVSDFTNMIFTADSSVTLSGCACSFEAEGQAFLRQGFTIVGGSGNVNVNLTALLESMQTLMTDQFSFFAASDVLISLQVLNASSIVHTFSFDSRLSIRPPTNSTITEIERQVSEAFTLQFNTQYSLVVSVIANSRAGQNEIPEPTSVLLLVSGLGFIAGVVKRRRMSR